MAICAEVRSLALAYVDKGHTRSEAAEVFGVTYETIGNWVRRREKTGEVSPRKVGCKGSRKVDYNIVLDIVKDKPDITLEEAAFKTGVSKSTVWRILQKNKMTYKKTKILC